MRPTTRIGFVLLAFILALGLQTMASAQEREQMPAGESGFKPNLARCAHLIGAEIKNNNNETLGTIKDFVLMQPPICDTAGMGGEMKGEMKGEMEREMKGEQGRRQQGAGQPGSEQQEGRHMGGPSGMQKNTAHIGYAVVLPAGGTPGNYVAVPWQAFRVSSTSLTGSRTTNITLNVDKQKLEQAPSFSGTEWPSTTDRSWMQKMCSYFNTQLPQTPGSEMGMHGKGTQKEGMYGQMGKEQSGQNIVDHHRLSRLFGTDVLGQQGQNALAQLKDVIMDTRDGVFVFAILDRSGEAGQREEDREQGQQGQPWDRGAIAVPWGSLKFEMKPDRITCRLEENIDRLSTIAIPENNFDRLGDLAFARDVFQRFDETPYWETFGYIKGSEQGRKKSESDQEPREKKERDNW